MMVETERLRLREFAMDDVDVLHALESIPEVVRYQSYDPKSRAQAEDYVRKTVESQKETPRRHFEWAVELRSPHPNPSPPEGRGVFVGRVGAWVEGGEATVWYAFMPAVQGKGFATEAMRAFIPHLGAYKLTIECDPRNEASWRLAERLGFVRESLVESAYECKGEWVGSAVYRKAATSGPP